MNDSEDIVGEWKTGLLGFGKPEYAVMKELSKEVAEDEGSKGTVGEVKIVVLLIDERSCMTVELTRGKRFQEEEFAIGFKLEEGIIFKNSDEEVVLTARYECSNTEGVVLELVIKDV